MRIPYFTRRRELRRLAYKLMEREETTRLAAVAERAALSEKERAIIDRMTRDIWLSN